MTKACLLFFFVLITCLNVKAQKAKLRLNLITGETYHLTSTSNLKTVQTINGNLLESDFNITAKISFKVSAIRDTLFDMQVSYDSLALKMDLPIGTINAGSASGAKDIYEGILSKLKSQSFLVVMARTGRIVSLGRLDSLISTISKTFTAVPEEQRAQAMHQIVQLLGEKAFKSNLEPCTYIFPSSPVNTNDKWSIDSQQEAPVPVNFHTLYILKGIAASGYSIEGLTIIQTGDKDTNAQLNQMPVKYSLGGNMSVTIQGDKATGWVTGAKISRLIKGHLQIKDNTQLPGGMLIPITITGNAVITK
ncbi:MAG: DUF6263 family protein [Mucilaginibacter sp.]